MAADEAPPGPRGGAPRSRYNAHEPKEVCTILPRSPTKPVSASDAPPAPEAALRDVLQLVGHSADLPRFRPVAGERVPEPYGRLLVHDEHMTVRLEAYHGRPVSLRVHDVRQAGDDYARKITLHTHEDGLPVLLGVLRFDLRQCAPETRAQVVAAKTPVGRILIEHDVMRRLRPGPYFRVEPDAGGVLLGVPLTLPDGCHARLARIDCNGGLAVQVLEIITAV